MLVGDLEDRDPIKAVAAQLDGGCDTAEAGSDDDDARGHDAGIFAAGERDRCASEQLMSGRDPSRDGRAGVLTRQCPGMYSTVTISSPDGETEAEFVPEANMVCRSLRHRGVELLDPGQGVEAYARYGKTMGIPLLHPWANRLAGPSYRIGETTVQLPAPPGRYATDPNGLPIHGALPGHLRWAVAPGSAPDRLSAVLSWRDRPA